MPTTGAYEFRLAEKSIGGVVADENDIAVGEWAWFKRNHGPDQELDILAIYFRDPDCKELCNLWYQLHGNEARGHKIDSEGNVTPSILHTWKYGDPPVERCGFHTQPTRLLDFVDLRGSERA